MTPRQLAQEYVYTIRMLAKSAAERGNSYEIPIAAEMRKRVTENMAWIRLNHQDIYSEFQMEHGEWLPTL